MATEALGIRPTVEESGHSGEKVAVVALTASGQFVLIVGPETDQTVGSERWTLLTIPQGKIEEEELMTNAAKRVLIGVAGYSSAYVNPYHRYQSEGGADCWIFLAEEAERVGQKLVGEPPRIEGHEGEAQAVKLNLDQVSELLSGGQIEAMIDDEITRVRLEVGEAVVAFSAILASDEMRGKIAAIGSKI